MAVTMSVVPDVVPAELDELSLPQAAPTRARAVKRTDAVAFDLIRTVFSLCGVAWSTDLALRADQSA
jgi:hypothetical protein